MPARIKTYVVWLRAIGPATHRVMSMAALAEACRSAGFGAVRVWAQTGNVLLDTPDAPARVEQRVDTLVAGFGLGSSNCSIVRSPAQLKAIARANPFPQAAIDRPSHLVVCFMAGAADAGAAANLEAHPGPERIRVIGRDVFVDYAESIGISKIAPGVIERRLQLVGTARNWNTIGKMIELAEAAAQAAP